MQALLVIKSQVIWRSLLLVAVTNAVAQDMCTSSFLGGTSHLVLLLSGLRDKA